MLEDLVIERTKRTPGVFLNHAEGTLDFKGVMMPAEGNYFFIPIIEWIEKYIQNPQPQTLVTIYVDLGINSSSVKSLMVIFGLLSRIVNAEVRVRVKWSYSSEDDLEEWQVFSSFFNYPFDYIKV